MIKIFKEIREERIFQDQKWGVQNHDPMTWLSILMEEVGETARAALEEKFGAKPSVSCDGRYVYNFPGKYRSELIQVAAVAVAMIECLDRNWDKK